MKFLTPDQIVELHETVMRCTGAHAEPCNRGRLESIVASVEQTFDGEHLIPLTLQAKAAALGAKLVRGHPFVDGNKRTGILAMLAFLQINDVSDTLSDACVQCIGHGLATGRVDQRCLETWIEQHILNREPPEKCHILGAVTARRE